MASLQGLFGINGSIGNLTFYRSGGEYRVRMKSRISKDRIKKSPEFARTRETMREFTTVSRGNKLLRSTFRDEIYFLSRKKLLHRLTSELSKVIRTDVVNERGYRSLANGDFNSLRGFDFDDQIPLARIMQAPFNAGIDSREGRLWVKIPSFNPLEDLRIYRTATHFKLIAAAAEIDFEHDSAEVMRNDSGLIELSAKPTPEFHLANMLAPDAAGALFLVFGILLYDEVGGNAMPRCIGGAMQLVEVCNE